MKRNSYTILKSKIKLSTLASLHNIQSPNIAIGLISNHFYEFWWFSDCRHPYAEYDKNVQKTQHKCTEYPILRHTYKEGPQDRANRQTKPWHRRTLKRTHLPVTQPKAVARSGLMWGRPNPWFGQTWTCARPGALRPVIRSYPSKGGGASFHI